MQRVNQRVEPNRGKSIHAVAAAAAKKRKRIKQYDTAPKLKKKKHGTPPKTQSFQQEPKTKSHRNIPKGSRNTSPRYQDAAAHSSRLTYSDEKRSSAVSYNQQQYNPHDRWRRFDDGGRFDDRRRFDDGRRYNGREQRPLNQGYSTDNRPRFDDRRRFDDGHRDFPPPPRHLAHQYGHSQSNPFNKALQDRIKSIKDKLKRNNLLDTERKISNILDIITPKNQGAANKLDMLTWFLLANLLGQYGNKVLSKKLAIDKSIKDKYREILNANEFSYQEIEGRHFSMILWSVGNIFRNNTDQRNTDKHIAEFVRSFVQKTEINLQNNAGQGMAQQAPSRRQHANSELFDTFFIKDFHIANTIKGLRMLNISPRREFPGLYYCATNRYWQKDKGLAAINTFISLGDDDLIENGEDQRPLNNLWHNIIRTDQHCVNLRHSSVDSSNIFKLLIQLLTTKQNKYQIPDHLLAILGSNGSFETDKMCNIKLGDVLRLLKSLALFTTEQNNQALVKGSLEIIKEKLKQESKSWSNLLLLDDICDLVPKQPYFQSYLSYIKDNILIPQIIGKQRLPERLTNRLIPAVHRLLNKHSIAATINLDIDYNALTLDDIGEELRQMIEKNHTDEPMCNNGINYLERFIQKLVDKVESEALSPRDWEIFSSVYIAAIQKFPRIENRLRAILLGFLKQQNNPTINKHLILNADLAVICQKLILTKVINSNQLNEQLDQPLTRLISSRLKSPEAMTVTTYALLYKAFAYLTELKHNYDNEINLDFIRRHFNALINMDVVALLQGLKQTRCHPSREVKGFVFRYIKQTLKGYRQEPFNGFQLAEIISCLANLGVDLPEEMLVDISRVLNDGDLRHWDYSNCIKLFRALCIFHAFKDNKNERQRDILLNIINKLLHKLGFKEPHENYIEIGGKRIPTTSDSGSRITSELPLSDRSKLMTVKSYLEAQQLILEDSIPYLDATEPSSDTKEQNAFIKYLNSELKRLQDRYKFKKITLDKEGFIDKLYSPFDIKLSITTEYDQHLTILIEINGNQHYMTQRRRDNTRVLTSKLAPRFFLKQRTAESLGAIVIQVPNKNTITEQGRANIFETLNTHLRASQNNRSFESHFNQKKSVSG
ncbi:MAG: hypothetical protein ACON35_00985 [Candidatus Marinamargulisbacteria bacterium]